MVLIKTSSHLSPMMCFQDLFAITMREVCAQILPVQPWLKGEVTRHSREALSLITGRVES